MTGKGSPPKYGHLLDDRNVERWYDQAAKEPHRHEIQAGRVLHLPSARTGIAALKEEYSSWWVRSRGMGLDLRIIVAAQYSMPLLLSVGAAISPAVQALGSIDSNR